MKRLRLLVLLPAAALLSGLLGCDVALVAVLASRSKSKSSSAASPAPNVSFNLWVAELGAITGVAEQGTLQGNHGDPDAKWTLLASATSSGEYTMPPPTAGGFDAILIQATDVQVYEVDAFEIIDATGTTLQTAAGATIFSSLDVVPTILDAQGPPNGKGALTAATSTDRSFIFMKRATPITTFRVNLWRPALRSSGDVEWAKTYTRSGDQRAGGAAITKNGLTYLGFLEGNSLLMLRYDSAGLTVLDTPGGNELTPLELTVPSSGSAAFAIDQNNDDVFVATTKNAGDISLYKFIGNNQLPTWSFPALSGSGVDRVEPNGLALNSAGELILAGGIDSGAPNGINHYLRKHSKANGADMWAAASPAPPAAPVDTAGTYWYAVATDATQSIFTTGDITSLVVPGNPEIYISKIVDTNTSSFNGGVTEAWNDRSRGSNTAPARGQAIGVDGSHNVYVAGFCTGTGLDSFILQYDGAISPPVPAPVGFFTLSRAGNDEFLDIAVEPDGTVYATGYETNGAQGEDLVLYKIAPDKTIAWKRTLDNANLADRGVKVMTTPTHVIVVGQIGVAVGDLDIHVRKYVK
jgi:hypothetical protein